MNTAHHSLAAAIAIALGLAVPSVGAQAIATPSANTASNVRADIDDLDGDLEPDPKVFIDAASSCKGAFGIAYSITTHHAPANTTGVEMQWMDENGATSQSLAQQATVPSGEGVFEVRALLHTTTGFYASDWQQVVVDCAPDLPLRATPDFTG